MTTTAAMLTVGDLVRRTNRPLHQLQYFIRSRGIEPITRVGGYRLFDERQAEQIAHDIQQLKRSRNNGR